MVSSFRKEGDGMTVEAIGAGSVAVYLDRADLLSRGATPAGLTLELARELAQAAGREVGVVLDGRVEIEAYPGPEGAMVFARNCPAPRVPKLRRRRCPSRRD